MRDALYTPRGGPSRIRSLVRSASILGHRAASWGHRPIRSRGIRGIRARSNPWPIGIRPSRAEPTASRRRRRPTEPTGRRRLSGHPSTLADMSEDPDISAAMHPPTPPKRDRRPPNTPPLSGSVFWNFFLGILTPCQLPPAQLSNESDPSFCIVPKSVMPNMVSR